MRFQKYFASRPTRFLKPRRSVRQQFVLLAITLFAFVMLSACGNDAANPTLPAPALKTVSPSAAFIATNVRPTLYKPLTKEACQSLNDNFAVTFRVSAGMGEGAFNDPKNGDLGNGCVFAMKGTGEEFVSAPEAINTLRASLTPMNWVEDKAYQANTPTLSAAAFRKEKSLLTALVEWTPTPDAKCPLDQVATCKLTPKQQLFVVTIKAAQR